MYVMSGETTTVLCAILTLLMCRRWIDFSGRVLMSVSSQRMEDLFGHRGIKKKWVALAKNADFSWREHVEQIFHYYQERTPGSVVSFHRIITG